MRVQVSPSANDTNSDVRNFRKKKEEKPTLIIRNESRLFFRRLPWSSNAPSFVKTNKDNLKNQSKGLIKIKIKILKKSAL